MPITGFAHYNLRAPAPLMEQLREFYVRVVGLSVGARPPLATPGYWLYAGGRDVLHLSVSRPGESRAVGTATTFDHAAFDATGLAAYETLLAAEGLSCRRAQVPESGRMQLFFRDPAGNGVELNFPAGDG